MTTTTQFATLGKEELRAACRAAGISYSKLNNDSMRALLNRTFSSATEVVAAVEPAPAAVAVNDTPEGDTTDDTPASAAGANVFAAMVNPVAAPAAQTPATVVRDGKVVSPDAPPADAEAGKVFTYNNRCPLCDAGLQNQTWANEGVSCMCHDCGKTYSITTGRKIEAGYTRENVNNGYKIQKERLTQNGKTRHSPGTICGNIWDAFDALRKLHGVVIAADLPALIDSNGWNKNNVMCEFYAWRKFNGITGRQVRSAVAAPAAETK